MEQLLSCVASDASSFGVMPVFLGPFTRMLHGGFSERLEKSIIPILREQRMRAKKTASADLFRKDNKDRYVAILCEFFEVEKDFSADQPYAWYLNTFREKIREYPGLEPVRLACEEVWEDWRVYQVKLSQALGVDERRIIQLEEHLVRFEDIFGSIKVGELFSNRYVQRVRVHTSFATHLVIDHRTLGYPGGPWIPPPRDLKDKMNDKELMPRQGEIVPLAINVVTALVRHCVCARLYSMSVEEWNRTCDQYFERAQRHVEAAQHLSQVKMLDRETEWDLHKLLSDTRTGSVKLDKEIDAAFGMDDLQPAYANVHSALVQVHRLVDAQPHEYSSGLSGGKNYKIPRSIPIPERECTAIAQCGFEKLREQIAALRKEMDERRALEMNAVHPDTVTASWLRLRASTIIASTPVTPSALATYAKLSREFFTGNVQKTLFEGRKASESDTKDITTLIALVDVDVTKLEKAPMVFLRDLLDCMITEVDVLWRLFKLADTMAAVAVVMPPPPPPLHLG